MKFCFCFTCTCTEIYKICTNTFGRASDSEFVSDSGGEWKHEETSIGKNSKFSD